MKSKRVRNPWILPALKVAVTIPAINGCGYLNEPQNGGESVAIKTVVVNVNDPRAKVAGVAKEPSRLHFKKPRDGESFRKGEFVECEVQMALEERISAPQTIILSIKRGKSNMDTAIAEHISDGLYRSRLEIDEKYRPGEFSVEAFAQYIDEPLTSNGKSEMTIRNHFATPIKIRIEKLTKDSRK